LYAHDTPHRLRRTGPAPEGQPQCDCNQAVAGVMLT
jgi:hypothetical protein